MKQYKSLTLKLFFTLPVGQQFVTRSGMDYEKVTATHPTLCEKCYRPIDSAAGLGDFSHHRVHICPREIVRPVEFWERFYEQHPND